MSLSTPAHLLNQLNWRYATKQFDPSKKIPPDVWAALEDALVLTPSSFGLQPWKFVVVSNPAVREKLLGASWGQKQVVEASHLLVLAIRTDVDASFVETNIRLITDVRNVPAESLEGLKKMILGFLPNVNVREWATRQAYIALGNFMTSAAMIGIDTCPMEGLDPAQYDTILGLTDRNLATVVACPTGYRAASDKYATLAKVRFPKSDLIIHI